jgi:hypothetical protein
MMAKSSDSAEPLGGEAGDELLVLSLPTGLVLGARHFRKGITTFLSMIRVLNWSRMRGDHLVWATTC